MKVNPGDKPKAIALVVAIVLIGGFGAYNFASRKGPTPPSGPTPDPYANLPKAETLAEGKTRPDPPVQKSEDLATVFPGSDGTMAVVNPFRTPVPQVSTASQAPKENTRPVASYNPPAGLGSNAPFKPFGESGIGGGSAPAVQVSEPMLVKGIIAPPDGESSGMAFIKVGNTSKGFRVGDIVTSGVRVTDISTGTVTVKIGSKTVTASVGQQIKLFE